MDAVTCPECGSANVVALFGITLRCEDCGNVWDEE